ncbi:MAG: 50S ribosomal protein L29 [Candidatus Marinimicrobia bacterium]|nr:50S ribosomal protein L29 [Candidatus Neomarinimicrobiota bacterium]MBL7023057.1 50S ribosomal protein L29 [Candidatus Neomarinimicrobiota bacterium]MBL7109077.1 50S ribosomal protein L29 [Candidatus Neomarinimicrobiota bacterium]
MKRHELTELSVAELETKLKDNNEALVNLRFQKVLQQLEHPQQITLLKREIAQIKTVLREYELDIRKEN